MSQVRARLVFTGTSLLRDAVVEFVHDTVSAVRPANAGDPPALDGLLMPGLVNAHTHLELAWAHQQAPGGRGFGAWVAGLLSLDPPKDPLIPSFHAAQAMYQSGTRAVCDISNGGHTAPLIAEAQLMGVVQHELLSMNPTMLADRLATAALPDRLYEGPAGTVSTRPSPHATYSTPPALIQAASRPGLHPASIHLGEDPDERALLTDGSGPISVFLDKLGAPWRDGWTAPGCGPVDYLDQLGLLGPQLMLVHGTTFTVPELKTIAAAKASLCLCPRSNLHITGQLPDVPAAIEAGVCLALGTDSLASNADLDVLGEVTALCERWPDVSPGVWLEAATRGGATALRLSGIGAFQVGYRPGALLLEGIEDLCQLRELPARRWICAPGATP